MQDVIYKTRETVFHQDYPNTEKRVENMTRSGVFLTKLEVFGYIHWIVNGTLSGVFDISSQSKQKLRSKWRSKIVKIYAN